ncbi:hypothetical protein C8F01DRAFT_1147436 [Mycena amicta]|nr:hypothetical protein C8F01DRAFT_1147436 [Mycena amicta]
MSNPPGSNVEPTNKTSWRRWISSQVPSWNAASPAQLEGSKQDSAEAQMSGHVVRGQQVIDPERRINELEQENQQLRAELLAARAATTRNTAVDLNSMADVRREMGRLAAEIHQLAATLADSHVRPRAPAGSPPDTAWCKYIVSVLGSEMTKAMTNSRRELPDVVVRMALESVLAFWSFSMINSWEFTMSAPERNELLNETFLRIAQHPDHTGNASLWRAMTHNCMQDHGTSQSLKKRQTLSNYITSVLVLVNPALPIASLGGVAEDRITAIYDLAFSLHRMIGAEILSETLEVTYFEPQTAFKSNAMENMWANSLSPDGEHSRHIVASTTGVGLAKKDLTGRSESVPLVRAKVLVAEDLKKILEDPS